MAVCDHGGGQCRQQFLFLLYDSIDDGDLCGDPLSDDL